MSRKLLRSGGVEGTDTRALKSSARRHRRDIYLLCRTSGSRREPHCAIIEVTLRGKHSLDRAEVLSNTKSLDKGRASGVSIWLRMREAAFTTPSWSSGQKTVDVDEAMDNAVRATKNGTALARKGEKRGRSSPGPGPIGPGEISRKRGAGPEERVPKAEQKHPNGRVGDSWGIGDPTASDNRTRRERCDERGRSRDKEKEWQAMLFIKRHGSVSSNHDTQRSGPCIYTRPPSPKIANIYIY